MTTIQLITVRLVHRYIIIWVNKSLSNNCFLLRPLGIQRPYKAAVASVRYRCDFGSLLILSVCLSAQLCVYLSVYLSDHLPVCCLTLSLLISLFLFHTRSPFFTFFSLPFPSFLGIVIPFFCSLTHVIIPSFTSLLSHLPASLPPAFFQLHRSPPSLLLLLHLLSSLFLPPNQYKKKPKGINDQFFTGKIMMPKSREINGMLAMFNRCGESAPCSTLP